MGTVDKKNQMRFRPEMVDPLKDIIAMVDLQTVTMEGSLLEGKPTEYYGNLVATVHWLSQFVYYPDE